MKSTVSRFSALNRRAEYLKLKAEKEKNIQLSKKIRKPKFCFKLGALSRMV